MQKLLGQSRHTQVLTLNKPRVWGCLIQSEIKFQTLKALYGLEFCKYLFDHFQINFWELLPEWVSLKVINSLVIVYFSCDKYLCLIDLWPTKNLLTLELIPCKKQNSFLHFSVWFETSLPIVLFCSKLLFRQASQLFYQISERGNLRNMEGINILSYFSSKSAKF